MDILPYLSYIAIVVVLGAWFLGSKVRAVTNTVIPFTEPVSYGLMIATVIVLYAWDPSDFYPIIVAFWVGYLIGYIIIGQVTSEWVSVHDLQAGDGGSQKICEVVYYEKDGQMYVQPQRFRDVCKHIFFRVEWPLELPIQTVYRHRYVEFNGRFITLKAFTVDTMNHKRVPMVKDAVRIGVYKKNWKGINKWGDDSLLGQPRYLFHFKCYRDIYQIAPYGTDAPYEFIKKTGIYVRAIKQLADARLANIDMEIEKILRTTEGGAIMLSKLVKLNPEDMMMSPLVNEIEGVMQEEDRLAGENRKLQREQAAMDEANRRMENDGGI